jgi:hypothetical protein
MIQVLTEFLDNTQRSLTHLEMRDTYGTGSAGYQAWRKGVPLPEIERLDDYFTPWNDLVAAHVARGVSFRRARVVSEPHSDYIAYEHAITPRSNLVGGEAVRWLPRPRAKDLALPGCDFWQSDEGPVLWVFQTGDGDPAGYELSADPAAVRLCSSAFEAAWQRAVDHGEYRPA